MARSKNILMMAILLGVIAAFAGYLGLRALARQVVKNTSKEFVPVVVTATDLTFGTKLDRTQLRVARYPKESVPQGAFSDVDSVAGQTTRLCRPVESPPRTQCAADRQSQRSPDRKILPKRRALPQHENRPGVPQSRV